MYITTQSAVYRIQSFTQDPEIVLDRPCRSVAAAQGIVVAADDAARLGMYRDKRWTWRPAGMSAAIESMLILRADPLDVLIGTEPPRIHRLGPDGIGPANDSFATLDCRDNWRTPWGGPPAVRSLAASSDGWIYADIHVGSIMRSPDRGLTWDPVTPQLNDDVHQVNTCPAAPDRIYANTAHAVYISNDRGDSWRYVGEDLDGRYGRAICVHPENPDLVLATVSDGPHGGNVHGQLWVTDNAGESWHHVTDGFPASTRGNIDTFHIIIDAHARAWACVGKTLYSAADPFTIWQTVWHADTTISGLNSE